MSQIDDVRTALATLRATWTQADHEVLTAELLDARRSELAVLLDALADAFSTLGELTEVAEPGLAELDRGHASTQLTNGVFSSSTV